ncbi:MAG: hypothetical protein M0R22_09420 [Dehalococcoidia bacterium]|jgi:hypothetical protein|nr:hypothetical protein [Dehalococcoidia bacterium]
MAVLMAVVVDSLNVDLDAIDETRFGLLYDAITSPHPASFASRRFRSALCVAWRSRRWPMMHDNTLLTWGRAWYRARVAPGLLDAGIDELDQIKSQGNFLECLGPYDEAMEYRRNS